MVQAGFAGVRQEERCTLALLQWAMQQQQQQQAQQAAGNAGLDSSGSDSREGNTSSGSGRVLLQLASPYLNLARPYESFLSRQARGICCCLLSWHQLPLHARLRGLVGCCMVLRCHSILH
jgi:hypothetical protein